MPGELIPIVIVPAFFLCIAFIVRIVSDNRIRRELLTSNASNEIIQKLFLDKPDEGITVNLKWGIVSVAIGLSLAIIQLSHLSGRDPLAYGVVFIFGGVGLLLYYTLRARMDRKT